MERTLPVKLTDDELLDRAKMLVSAIAAVEAEEATFAEIKSDHKGRLEDLQEDLDEAPRGVQRLVARDGPLLGAVADDPDEPVESRAATLGELQRPIEFPRGAEDDDRQDHEQHEA